MLFNLNINNVVKPFFFYKLLKLVEKVIITARKFSFYILSKDFLTRYIFFILINKYCVTVQTTIIFIILLNFPNLNFYFYNIRYRLYY